ncbi:hypothetical protein LTR95_002811 [Oleoguttula sp. CCFEE 5521]
MTESITYLLVDAIIELVKTDMHHCAFWVRTFALAVVGRDVIREAIDQAQYAFDKRNYTPRGEPPSQILPATKYRAAMAALSKAIDQLDQPNSKWRDPLLSQRRDALIELWGTIEIANMYGADGAARQKLSWPIRAIRLVREFPAGRLRCRELSECVSIMTHAMELLIESLVRTQRGRGANVAHAACSQMVGNRFRALTVTCLRV